MNEVLKINYETEQPTVSARELHEALGVASRFSRWFDSNKELFVEGEDYNKCTSSTVVNNGARRELEDYSMSVLMAKHICLMSRTEKGKRCRDYLIDLEKAWNTPEQIMARALKMANHSIESLKGRCKFLGEQVVEQQQIITELQPKLIWEEEKIHGFDGVPATEYVENKERTCIFEPAMSMIDAYNKAISEKANDVDYFADAYMKILGATLDDDDVEHIRDNRIINFDEDADRLIVDFLQKPDGDTTQEHLIDRLEKLIFQISMVANISDENFGTSSGIAMKYKLQGMSNLAKTKERKFTSGMNRRYKLIFSNPVSGMKEDDWVKLHYHFTPNIPSNVLEESQIAGNLEGIVSQETQLGVLSVVDNVQNEMKKIENEQEKAKTDPVMMQMFGGAGDGKSGVLEKPGNRGKEA